MASIRIKFGTQAHRSMGQKEMTACLIRGFGVARHLGAAKRSATSGQDIAQRAVADRRSSFTWPCRRQAAR